MLLTVITFVPLALALLIRTPLVRFLDDMERKKLKKKLLRIITGEPRSSGKSPSNVAV